MSVYYPDQDHPQVIGERQGGIGQDRPPGIFEVKGDSAKFLVQLRRFRRPRLRAPNGDKFVWPQGTEGIVVSGQAKLGVKTYIGDDRADVQVIHRDEARVEMSGSFMGETSAVNFQALRALIISNYPQSGLLLDIPGVFQYEHHVYVESYEFDHPEDSNEEDFSYRVMFVDTGKTRKRLPSNKSTRPPTNPKTKKGKGKSPNYVRVKDGLRTLRGISKKVYRDANKWKTLYNKNRKVLNEFMKAEGIPLAKLPTRPLPIGLKIYF